MIVGVGQETIVSAALRERGFQYEFRAEGDGTVPLSRARWTEAATWFVNENHGALTQERSRARRRRRHLEDAATRAACARLRHARRTLHHGPSRDDELRAIALRKVQWDTLSLDSRRRILEPVLSPEFLAPQL